MEFNPIVKKELHVVAHGQSARFRAVKYAILIPLFIALYLWSGWGMTWKVLLALAIFGIIVHFLLRWKTNGWTQSWWLFRPDDLRK